MDLNIRQYALFVGYNKNSKIPTMSLNTKTNKYCCFRCGAEGFSIGLYAKIKKIDNKKAYKELLERECFSPNKSPIEISPINLLADIKARDTIYRDFLSMLKLDGKHKIHLKNMGFLDASIEDNLYKSVPKNYIKRRLICSSLSKEYDLCGVPGFYQEEDFHWCFSRMDGFFVPVYDQNGYIQGLSIHLDKPFNNATDMWFSSTDKINGTGARSWIMKNNIFEDTKNLIITDNFLLSHLIKETLNAPIIAFQNITNSYMILKEIEKTNIENITFVFRMSEYYKDLNHIINRVFRNLIPLGYNLKIKYIKGYKDFFNEDFSVFIH